MEKGDAFLVKEVIIGKVPRQARWVSPWLRVLGQAASGKSTHDGTGLGSHLIVDGSQSTHFILLRGLCVPSRL